ncbi:MAG: hypothetical protein NT040_12300 [Bacteroidetes bacterium]|nr:hypothetical protein [Bacteroidota bacterium]
MNEVTNKKKKNIFERNPKITITFLLLFVFVILDCIIAQLVSKKESKKHYSNFHSYYHHALKPNLDIKYTWGKGEYKLSTNSLGFKDSVSLAIDKRSSKKRFLFIGDSFTEGIGIDFGKTFVGILKSHYPEFDIQNAGVRSYSPKLYYLKTRYLIEEEHIWFDELVVFIDISDIQDELVYENFIPHKPEMKSFFTTLAENILTFIKENSFILSISTKKNGGNSTNQDNKRAVPGRPYTEPAANGFSSDKDYQRERPRWTFDDEIYRKWGKRGIGLAIRNMQKLYDLCTRNGIKLTIAVYPWPDQIRQNDLECKEVIIWKDFAQLHQIRFIDFFPDFITAQDTSVIKKYFIEGDVHWNEQGHKKIADKIILENYIQ